MLQLSKLHKEVGDKVIFDSIDLSIYDGEKVGIIGNNGVGKTTLLNIIAGVDKNFNGVCKVDGEISYLKQSSFLNFENLYDIMCDKDKCNALFHHLKVMNFNGDLGNLENLSCGEKTKLAFAINFVNNPQILLLDEPTNHIDLLGRQVITNLVKEFKGTVIVVSHDIDFLNDTVTRILEIENAKINDFVGNYDSYLMEKEKIKLAQERAYISHTKKVKEIKQNIEFVKKFAEKAERDVGKQGGMKSDSRLMTTKSKAMVHAKKLNQTVASRISRLEQQIDNAPPKPEKDKEIKYKLQVDDLKVKSAVKFENVSFGYCKDKSIFENINFEIFAGEKVGIIGNNGVGKSTLVKLITNELKSDSGVIRRAGSLKIKTMEQDVYDLDEQKTINELALNGDNEYRNTYLRNLINMNIDKTRFNTKIENLSLGERMRIKLNELILSDANFLILDEPTNHFDIANKNFMQKVLSNFVGTLLLISHDLNFIKNTCNKIYKIENSKITLVKNF